MVTACKCVRCNTKSGYNDLVSVQHYKGLFLPQCPNLITLCFNILVIRQDKIILAFKPTKKKLRIHGKDSARLRYWSKWTNISFCCQIVNYENEWARKSTDRYEYKWCRQRRVPVESIIHIIYIWPSIFCPFAVINYNLMDR